MNKVFLFFLIFLMSNSISSRAASDDYSLISTVYSQKRSGKEDIIIFRNNDTLRGQVVNEKISIAARYGMFSIPVRSCAGIAFADARRNTDSAVTVNFNRFTGVITDKIIKLKIDSSGSVVPVRKEKIRYILFKKTANESVYQTSNPQSDLFVLKNGDLISGESSARKITVGTDNTKVTVNLSEIKTIVMKGDRNVNTVITKTNGEILQGSLSTDEISINLDLGVTIKSVYKDEFDKIYIDQAQKQAPAQFALKTSAEGEPGEAVFSDTGEPLKQTIDINLEPALGKRGTRMKLALIPAGNFVMGSGSAEEGRGDNEGPVRRVIISRPYYMGIYEVTQEQYIAVMGNNPGRFNGLNNPVEQVSWAHAIFFCKRMSEITKLEVTLPTEAEWEYAARAGSQTRFYFGDDDSELDIFAWYAENSEDKTHSVGQKKPNEFGLYDIHGNVYEWCFDRYQGSYMNLPEEDPVGPKMGSRNVIRGGGWNSDPKVCRSANRSYGTPDLRNSNLGFRVIIVPKDKQAR